MKKNIGLYIIIGMLLGCALGCAIGLIAGITGSSSNIGLNILQFCSGGMSLGMMGAVGVYFVKTKDIEENAE